MSKLRSINTAFWSDPFIEDLTPSEKLLFLYLITNEKTNMLGIYEASIKKMSFETGIDKQTVRKALEGFERVGKVKYIDNYVILVNYMKHQNYNTNMKKSAIDAYNSLPQVLKNKGIAISKDNPSEGFERLSKALLMVSKDEVEVETELEVEDEVETESEEEDKNTGDALSSLDPKKNEPSFEDFANHAYEKAMKLRVELDELKLQNKYEAWRDNEWHTLDKSNRKIKNWKSTLTHSIQHLKKEKNGTAKKGQSNFEKFHNEHKNNPVYKNL